MRISATDQTRNVHLDETNAAEDASRATRPQTNDREPNWDRVPTLDAATLQAIQAGIIDVKELKTKLEQLRSDLQAFREAVGPFAHELHEALEGAKMVQDAVEMLLTGVLEHPSLLPLLAPAALATAAAGGYKMVHGLEGCSREAKQTVEKGKPAAAKVLHDIEELKAAVKAATTPKETVERSAYVRA